MVGNGSVIAGGVVDHSVIFPGVTVLPGARVDASVIMHGVTIGKGAVIRRAILDKNVHVPDDAQIGVDHEADKARGYTVSDGGVVVLGKNEKV
jgi:glucose-1-phosphate adenylyltransferase